MKLNAIYPGTFDPITIGHINILKRATKIFDHIILAIFSNIKKNTLFTLNERIKLAKKATKNLYKVKVEGFNELLVSFAKKRNIKLIIRGIRSFSDFEKEKKYAYFNKKLEPKLESIFFLSLNKNSFISSSAIKEITFYKGNTKKFLPLDSYQALIKKIQK